MWFYRIGWFRQCDVIPYSGDVDIGIMADDFKTDLIDAMKRVGFSLKFIFGKVLHLLYVKLYTILIYVLVNKNLIFFAQNYISAKRQL